MLKPIGRFLNQILDPLGYRLADKHRIIPRSSEANWVAKLNIETIIDIGSNEGQFINDFNKVLPGKKYYAFEPIHSCYTKLLKNTQGIDVTAFNIGLSDVKQETEINISNNLVSSSILPMEKLHKESYPESEFIRKETISIELLDEVVKDLTLQKNILIKLDVQGFEKHVLKGGKKTFANASAIIVESAFEEFYKDQWLFSDLYNYFTGEGFKFIGFTEQFHSPKTGIPLYADSIFIKKEMTTLVL